MSRILLIVDGAVAYDSGAGSPLVIPLPAPDPVPEHLTPPAEPNPFVEWRADGLTIQEVMTWRLQRGLTVREQLQAMAAGYVLDAPAPVSPGQPSSGGGDHTSHNLVRGDFWKGVMAADATEHFTFTPVAETASINWGPSPGPSTETVRVTGIARAPDETVLAAVENAVLGTAGFTLPVDGCTPGAVHTLSVHVAMAQPSDQQTMVVQYM